MKLTELLSVKYTISKRSAKEYIKKGCVFLDSKKIYTNIEADETQEYTIKIYQPHNNTANKSILVSQYDDVLFAYKPPFVHSERQRLEDEYCVSDFIHSISANYRMISRLDYETDGIIAAINSGIEISFMQKKYYALVNGTIQEPIVIDNIIDADKKIKVRVLESSSGQYTKIRPIEMSKSHTLIEVTLEKASRHQIRAYTSYLNTPIVGDKLYGNNDYSRLMLHCFYNKINDREAFSPLAENFLSTAMSILAKSYPQVL